MPQKIKLIGMKENRKCSTPSQWFMVRPNILGNQKIIHANEPMNTAAAMVRWKWPTTK